MEEFEQASNLWSDYIKYRANLRGFDLSKIENILRYLVEKYFDTITGRKVVVGRHGDHLVMEHALDKMRYFKDEDFLHLPISEESEASSVELSPEGNVQ